ncbi:MAG: PocR ligand-binding domain-containing protein [Proteobacteria bacterium]|nr:PocR ligand-binding domain-containing protein [Pseudomonadota bacterium]
MTLTDILPVEQWEALEREIVERFGLNASVMDDAAARVTTYDNFCNRLCERIKTDPKGRSAICSVAGTFFASEIRQTGEPLLAECDAGFTKIAVPIIVQGKVLGNVGGCGVIVDDGEVDDFMVARSLGVDEEELVGYLAGIPKMTMAQAEEALAWLEQRVEELLKQSH